MTKANISCSPNVKRRCTSLKVYVKLWPSVEHRRSKMNSGVSFNVCFTILLYDWDELPIPGDIFSGHLWYPLQFLITSRDGEFIFHSQTMAVQWSHVGVLLRKSQSQPGSSIFFFYPVEITLFTESQILVQRFQSGPKRFINKPKYFISGAAGL